MFPRLAFVTLSNNLMILSLRSMMGEFISEFFVSTRYQTLMCLSLPSPDGHRRILFLRIQLRIMDARKGKVSRVRSLYLSRC